MFTLGAFLCSLRECEKLKKKEGATKPSLPQQATSTSVASTSADESTGLQEQNEQQDGEGRVWLIIMQRAVF